MPITTEKYVRKPLYVDAVQLTTENFLEMAFWCQGSIKQNDGSEMKPAEGIDPSKQHIHVPVSNPNPKYPRQAKAFLGDWILRTEQGLKVYTEKAFKSSFNRAKPSDQLELVEVMRGGEVIAEISTPERPEPTPEDPIPVPQEPTPEDPIPVPQEPTPAEPVPAPEETTEAA